MFEGFFGFALDTFFFFIMDKIRILADRLKKFNSEKELLTIATLYEDNLTQLNKDQLQDSIDANGEPLGEYKSISYANLKGRITVDLKLTGAFYDGFFTQSEQFPILFDSVDKKTSMLKEKYGKEIVGLTKQSKSIANKNLFLPKLLEKIKATIRV